MGSLAITGWDQVGLLLVANATIDLAMKNCKIEKKSNKLKRLKPTHKEYDRA